MPEFQLARLPVAREVQSWYVQYAAVRVDDCSLKFMLPVTSIVKERNPIAAGFMFATCFSAVSHQPIEGPSIKGSTVGLNNLILPPMIQFLSYLRTY